MRPHPKGSHGEVCSPPKVAEPYRFPDASIDTPPSGANPSFVPVKVCSTLKLCACVRRLVATINGRASRRTKTAGLIVLPIVHEELFAGFVMMVPFTQRSGF